MCYDKKENDNINMNNLERNEQFEHLLNAIEKHANDIDMSAEGFVHGTVKGYRFRLFESLNEYTVNGTRVISNAFLCIEDENSRGSMWSAFYDEVDIDEWIKDHE